MTIIEKQELYSIAIKIRKKAVEYYERATAVSNGSYMIKLDNNIEELDVIIKELKK